LMNLEISSEEEEEAEGERREEVEKKKKPIIRKKPKREDNEINPFDLKYIFERGNKMDSRVDIVRHLIVDRNSALDEKKGKKYWENFSGWPFVLRSKKQSVRLLNNHIIICGKVNKLFWFVAALRQKYLENTGMYKQIVVLDPDYLKYTGDSEHGKINQFFFFLI
jgi:hypothetical protein